MGRETGNLPQSLVRRWPWKITVERRARCGNPGLLGRLFHLWITAESNSPKPAVSLESPALRFTPGGLGRSSRVLDFHNLTRETTETDPTAQTPEALLAFPTPEHVWETPLGLDHSGVLKPDRSCPSHSLQSSVWPAEAPGTPRKRSP